MSKLYLFLVCETVVKAMGRYPGLSQITEIALVSLGGEFSRRPTGLRRCYGTA